MYLTISHIVQGGIDVYDYTDIRSLTFTPEADVTATSLPINEFTAEVVTDDGVDHINYGDPAELFDDLDNIWASYYVTEAVDLGCGVVRVKAQSPIAPLQYVTVEPVMYTAEPVSDALNDLDITYTLDSSFSSATLTGFCPEQTARERLQWICFAIGAYVRTAFNDEIEILPVPTAETLIPLNRTFWRPSVSMGEWVTGVKVTAFTFTQASSQAEWENDDSSYRFPLPWVATEQELSLSNPDAPAEAPENVIEIAELYLINASNASAILSRLAAYYFSRMEVNLDCVNNAEIEPGQKVIAYTDPDRLVAGYVKSAAFKYGLQARSTLKLIAAEGRTGAQLTVNYLYQSGNIGRAVYTLPVGYSYTIANPYIDRTYQGRRFVYRPQNAAATGTIASGANTSNQNYDVALDDHNDVLSVLYVDDIQLQNGIGVIS